MEAKGIYENSYKEMNKLKRELSQETISIDFSKMDTVSTGVIKTALSEALTERTREVYKIISNPNN